MKKRTIFQIIYAIVVLVLLYKLGLQIKILITFAILVAAIIIFRGPLYNKLDNLLTKRFKSLSKLNPKLKKAIIIIVFILVFILIKQILFFILNILGIDIQTALAETINNTLQN